MGDQIAVIQYMHKKGYLYYCKRDKDGLVAVYEAEMASTRRKREKAIAAEQKGI
jgi:hypothetical protein